MTFKELAEMFEEEPLRLGLLSFKRLLVLPRFFEDRLLFVVIVVVELVADELLSLSLLLELDEEELDVEFD